MGNAERVIISLGGCMVVDWKHQNPVMQQDSYGHGYHTVHTREDNR